MIYSINIKHPLCAGNWGFISELTVAAFSLKDHTQARTRKTWRLLYLRIFIYMGKAAPEKKQTDLTFMEITL